MSECWRWFANAVKRGRAQFAGAPHLWLEEAPDRQSGVCLCSLVSECGFGLNYKEHCMKKLVLEAAATSFQWQKKGGW
jgi:hypothetical protein